MNNEIIFKRGYVWNNLPRKSIAIDGAYRGPFIDNKNEIYSFDHHDNCIRHCTKASCIQVMESILLGFSPNDYKIYVNDFDEDTLISTALIIYPEIVKNEKAINFINKVGKLDEHGSVYPLDEKFWKEYYSMKSIVMNNYDKKKSSELTSEEIKILFINSINNFKTWVDNDLKVIEDIKQENLIFEITPLTNNDKWIMVKSTEYNIFSKIYNTGFNAIVLWSELSNGSFNYTIAKKSEFVNFPIKEILEYLNSFEKGWGGSSTIGGAPRNENGTRSFLRPEKIVDLINNFLIENNK